MRNDAGCGLLRALLIGATTACMITGSAIAEEGTSGESVDVMGSAEQAETQNEDSNMEAVDVMGVEYAQEEDADSAEDEDEGEELIHLPVDAEIDLNVHPVFTLRPEPFSDGDAWQLALEELMAMALENNIGLKLSEFALEKDHFTVDQTYYSYDPNFTWRLNYGRSAVGTAEAASRGGLSGSESYSTDFTINKPREQGDSFSFSYGLDRSGFSILGETADATELPTTFGSEFSLGYNRPLGRGGSKFVNLIPRYQASNSLMLSYEQFDDQVRTLKGQILDIYYQAVALREVINVREASLERALAQLEREVERYKVGLAIRADMLQAESSVLSQRSQLLQARKNYIDTLDGLVELIGLPNEVDLTFDAESVLIELGSTLPKELWELVEENSIELKSLCTQIDNLNLQREALEDQLNENINLSINYSRNGEEESLSDAVGSYGNENYGVGITWSDTPGDRNTKAEIAKAELDLASIDLRIQDTELQLKSQLRTLQRDLETKLNQLQLARQNVEVAQETYDITVERNNVGLATTLDVVEAQETLLNAELSVLQAKVDYQFTYRQIMLLAGLI